MKVKFLRVIGIRSHRPGVVAIVDGLRVRWDPKGWSCDCDDFEVDWCQHVLAVDQMLDPKVTGGDSPCLS